MRRDLSFGCSSCRLRFSATLSQCPACGGAALSAADASLRVEPPTRAAWIVKWAIALSLVPAFVAVASALVAIEGAQFPPRGAFGVLLLVVSALGIFAGVSIVVAIPLAVWIGLVSLLRLLVGRFVDRPARALRPALDRAPRRSSRSATTRGASRAGRLWERWVSIWQSRRKRVVGAALGALVALEVGAEIFGGDRIIETSSLGMFGLSFLAFVFLNTSLLGLAFVPARFVFGGFVWFFEWLGRPPALFGRGAAPPVRNDALISEWRSGRVCLVGRAAPLGESERVALARRPRAGLSSDERAALRSPTLAVPCLAFRLKGESGGAFVDDADAVSFALVSDEGRRVVVDAADVVVALEPRSEGFRSIEPGFLRSRGLPESDVSIHEGLLREGDRVSVTGHLSALSAAGAGYRQASQFEVLDAEDGSPVVVEAASV